MQTLKDHKKLVSIMSFIIQVAKAKITLWVVASNMKSYDFNSQSRIQKVRKFLIIMLTIGFDSEFVFMLNFTLLMILTSRAKTIVIFGYIEELMNITHAERKIIGQTENQASIFRLANYFSFYDKFISYKYLNILS